MGSEQLRKRGGELLRARALRLWLSFVCYLAISCTAVGCGSGIDCNPLLGSLDPSGRWKGTLTRVESDCGAKSRGSQFNFDHDVSLECSGRLNTKVYLFNEDNLEFKETDFSVFGGGSFTVQNERSTSTIDISYKNFDGSLAEVSQKIRVYSEGKLVCSERYRGQGKR